MILQSTRDHVMAVVLGLLLWRPCVASAQSPESAPLDSATFQLLTKGMPDELRERYREAISSDAELRAAIFGQSAGPGAYAATAVALRPAPPPAQALVKKDSESAVRRADGSGVRVPAGALEQDLRITVSQSDAGDEPKRARQAALDKLQPVSLPVEFGPAGTKFRSPVTIALAYDPSLLAARGIVETALKVYYWNAVASAWDPLPSVVDRLGKTVSAQTTHFSSYQAMGPGVAATDAALSIKAAYAFPNPVRGQGPVTIRVQPGLADSVEVRVYDLTGRRVHSSSDFRSVGAFDDGNGLGPQFTYEHAWDLSGIASGVYTFATLARKAGQPDVRKTGKVAVIK